MSLMHLILLRHAPSAPSPELEPSRYPLSPQGHKASQDLASDLALELQGDPRPIRLVSSPWPRALDTLSGLAELLGLGIETDASLRERHISDRWEDDFKGWVSRSFEDRDLKRPGCESIREAQVRALAWLDECVDPAADELVVVSTHGQLMTSLLDAMIEIDPFAFWASMGFPHRVDVTYDGSQWSRAR